MSRYDQIAIRLSAERERYRSGSKVVVPEIVIRSREDESLGDPQHVLSDATPQLVDLTQIDNPEMLIIWAEFYAEDAVAGIEMYARAPFDYQLGGSTLWLENQKLAVFVGPVPSVTIRRPIDVTLPIRVRVYAGGTINAG